MGSEWALACFWHGFALGYGGGLNGCQHASGPDAFLIPFPLYRRRYMAVTPNHEKPEQTWKCRR